MPKQIAFFQSAHFPGKGGVILDIEYKSSATIHLDDLCEQIEQNTKVDTADYDMFNIKRGLRNSDGTGVMAGLTSVCNVEGYYIDDNERIPREGKLRFRGINMK